MPTYSYACTECGNRFDVVQDFTDDSLTNCDQCDGRLRKIFGKVGVVFKGSGFYRTDSREAGKSSSAGSGNGSSPAKSESGSTATEKSASTEKSSSDSKPSGKPATPAAAPAATSS